MEPTGKTRGVLSTVLISFFLTSFAGFLWIGRGTAALIALAVMIASLVLVFTFDGVLDVMSSDHSFIAGLGGWQLGAWVDYTFVGAVHVAVVLVFKGQARATRWYSNGFAVVGLCVVLPVVLAVGFRTFLFQPFSIPSGSMSPALVAGDHLFVSKYAYGYSRHSAPFSLLPVPGRVFSREPKRGDIVVFKFPPDPSVDYIKRVIGLPGEQIQMVDGVLHIDGEAVGLERRVDVMTLAEDDIDAEVQMETLPNGVSYKILNLVDDSPGDNSKAYKIPAGHVFVLGDNRDNATDSRFNVGFVPFELLVGRAEWIYWNGEGKDYADRARLRPDRR